jgi:hypothetical protein
MAVKVNFFFQYLGQGWSESFYRSGPFTGSDQVLMTNYITKRMKLASTEINLISVRTSDVNSARDVIITDIGIDPVPGTWVYKTADPTGPNQTAQAILLRLSDNAQHYRTFNLLGLPDHIIQDNQVVPTEVPLLKGRLDDWRDAIASAGFQMRINAPSATTGTIDTFGAQTDLAPLVKINTTGALPAKGALVQITGSKPWRLLNRTWRVAASGAGQFSLSNSKSLQCFGEVEGGKYKVPTYNYVSILSYTYGRVSVRRTGIPFGLQHGRRSSKM